MKTVGQSDPNAPNAQDIFAPMLVLKPPTRSVDEVFSAQPKESNRGEDSDMPACPLSKLTGQLPGLVALNVRGEHTDNYSSSIRRVSCQYRLEAIPGENTHLDVSHARTVASR